MKEWATLLALEKPFHVVLGSPGCLGDWTRWLPENPANLSPSVILWSHSLVPDVIKEKEEPAWPFRIMWSDAYISFDITDLTDSDCHNARKWFVNSDSYCWWKYYTNFEFHWSSNKMERISETIQYFYCMCREHASYSDLHLSWEQLYLQLRESQ